MNFSQFALTGTDADKFLQGQLTANVAKINDCFLPTAICNLKGRIAFGLWIRRIDDGFCVVLAEDLADAFKIHIKKYGAFSKISLSQPSPIYPCVMANAPTFSLHQSDTNWQAWATLSIEQGNFWITSATTELFQPQELRLHQRGGVDYDKGCYLGQEIVARLYFKASPKAYLHRVMLNTPLMAGQTVDKVGIVNAVGLDALVVGTPDDVARLGQIIPLPTPLDQSVARV